MQPLFIQSNDAPRPSPSGCILGASFDCINLPLNGEVTEYDDSLVRRLIERITVYDDHFTVEFKSGIETDVQM